MAWTAISTVTTGDLIDASEYNDQVLNNISHLAAMTTKEGTALSSSTAVVVGPNVGFLQPVIGTASDGNRWLICAGGTIGGASSGGTVRANADMETLFTHLWTTVANAELAIQDSGGSPSTRGASAAADFAANKRMPLPDLRGRVLIGLDNLGGSSANVVTDTEADTIGDVSGTETHTLAAAEIPNNSTPSTVATGGATNFANDSHTGSASSAHNNMQPYMSVGWLIYTGN